MTYEVIFAADRGAYVSRLEGPRSHVKERKQRCTFCAIRDNNPDVFTRRIHVDEKAMVLMNIYPYSPGHLQVIPPRHVERLEELSREEVVFVMEYLRRSIYLICETLKPKGYNIGINLGEAGASIPHIHIQLVPRYDCPLDLGQERVQEIFLKSAHLLTESPMGAIDIAGGRDPPIFQIGEKEIDGERVRVGINAKPYNRGHLIFLTENPILRERPKMLADLLSMVLEYKAVLKRIYKPNGFNIGMNLGDVPLNSSRALHLVPRFRRESGFMEVVAGTRVVVEDLEEMKKKIADLFGKSV